MRNTGNSKRSSRKGKRRTGLEPKSERMNSAPNSATTALTSNEHPAESVVKRRITHYYPLSVDVAQSIACSHRADSLDGEKGDYFRLAVYGDAHIAENSSRQILARTSCPIRHHAARVIG